MLHSTLEPPLEVVSSMRTGILSTTSPIARPVSETAIHSIYILGQGFPKTGPRFAFHRLQVCWEALVGAFHLWDGQMEPGSSRTPLRVIGIWGLCLMTGGVLSTGRKMLCNLHIYFSCPLQSVPLPRRWGAMALLESLWCRCLSSIARGAATQKWG